MRMTFARNIIYSLTAEQFLTEKKTANTSLREEIASTPKRI